MPEERWIGTAPDGTKAEYCYHQSGAGIWATRKVAGSDIEEIVSSISGGLTREQVEKEFVE